MTPSLKALLIKGQNHLFQGELTLAKKSCLQISEELATTLLDNKDWEIIQTFLKEILLAQKLEEWKNKNSSEYQELQKEFQTTQKELQIELNSIENYL